MRELTADQDIVIIERTTDPVSVVYESASRNQRWRVYGVCNQCGLCAIGAAPAERYVWDGPPGTPHCNRDLLVPGRLDEPIAPGFIEDMREMATLTPTATVDGCSLSLEVLD